MHKQMKYYQMPKKSALQKIEEHEKLCRIMQKQTFARIARLEKWIISGLFAVVLSLLSNHFG